jgi:hypothetical protein
MLCPLKSFIVAYMTDTSTDLTGDEDTPEIVAVSFYVNVYPAGYRLGYSPDCVTDEHLGSEGEARQFALDYLRDNPDIVLAEISSYTTMSDDTSFGSDSPLSSVCRDDIVETDRPG